MTSMRLRLVFSFSFVDHLLLLCCGAVQWWGGGGGVAGLNRVYLEAGSGVFYVDNRTQPRPQPQPSPQPSPAQP